MSKVSLRELLHVGLTAKGTPKVSARRAVALLNYSARQAAFPRTMEAWLLSEGGEIPAPEFSLRIQDEEDACAEADASHDHMRAAIKDVPVRLRKHLRYSLWFIDG